jgi:hypothetical protein
MSIGNRLFGYETAPGCLKNRLLQLIARAAPGLRRTASRQPVSALVFKAKLRKPSPESPLRGMAKRVRP